jgi:hypothetical protein
MWFALHQQVRKEKACLPPEALLKRLRPSEAPELLAA